MEDPFPIIVLYIWIKCFLIIKFSSSCFHMFFDLVKAFIGKIWVFWDFSLSMYLRQRLENYLTCCLFLYGPWAKMVFTFFDNWKSEKKKNISWHVNIIKKSQSKIKFYWDTEHLFIYMWSSPAFIQRQRPKGLQSLKYWTYIPSVDFWFKGYDLMNI